MYGVIFMEKKDIIEIINKLAQDNVVVEYEKIPEIELYMDQLTTFTEEKLKPYKRRDGDKVLTKTMINNYSKERLIPPSAKKRYSRAHIAQMLMIYHLKNTLAINDIGAFVKYLNTNDYGTERLYRAFVKMQEMEAGWLEEEIMAKMELLGSLADKDGDGLDWAVLAVISLIIDANSKKRAAEKILDMIVEKKK